MGLTIAFALSSSEAQISLFFSMWLIAWAPIALVLAVVKRWKPFRPLSPVDKLPFVLSLYAIAPVVMALVLYWSQSSWSAYGISRALLQSGTFFLGFAIGSIGLVSLFYFYFLAGWVTFGASDRSSGPEFLDPLDQSSDQIWVESHQNRKDALNLASNVHCAATEQADGNSTDAGDQLTDNQRIEQPVITGSNVNQTLSQFGLILALWGLSCTIGLIEELVFRGFLTGRLLLFGSVWWAGAIASLVFALLHLVWEGKQNIPQLPGLWVMGGVLTIAWWVDQQSIGLAWGLHAGWVWVIATIDTFHLVHYRTTVPGWITGYGGKPLAGIMGIAALAITGVLLLQLSKWGLL